MDVGMKFTSPEEEIRYLEERILEKKHALESHSSREIISEAIKEHAANATPPPLPAGPDGTVGAGGQAAAVATDADELDRNVSRLVQVAFQSGVMSAVAEARHAHNPHLLDALHDALVDRFYDDLKARGLLHD